MPARIRRTVIAALIAAGTAAVSAPAVAAAASPGTPPGHHAVAKDTWTRNHVLATTWVKAPETTWT